MRQRFPRTARPLVAVAALTFAAFGIAAATWVARRGPDLVARLYVIQICRSDDPTVRKDTATALRKIGPRGIPAVASRAREGPVPDEVFELLVDAGDPSTVDVLASQISGAPESRRAAAARGLAKIGTSEAALALGPALADPREEVRQVAREGLRGQGAEVVRGVVASVLAVPTMAREGLREQGAEVVRGVVASELGVPTMAPEVVLAYLVEEGLVRAANEPLVEAMESGEGTRMWNALYLARGVYAAHPPGPESEEGILRAVRGVLDRVDPAGQAAAISVLATLDLKGRGEVLCSIANGRRYPEPVRVDAIQAFSPRDAAVAMPVLAGLARSGRMQVRIAAAEAMGRLGTEAEAEKWMEEIEQQGLDYDTRELLLRAVGLAGGAGLTPRLLALLQRAESPATAEAIRRVSQRDPRASFAPLLDALREAQPGNISVYGNFLQDLTWHRSRFHFLPRSMEEFVEARQKLVRDWEAWWKANGELPVEEWRARGMTDLENELSSPVAQVRMDAVQKLLRIDPPELEARLLTRLADPEELIWGKVLEVILARRSVATIELLRLEVANGGTLAASRAARVLGMIEDKSSLPILTQASRRPEPAVRRECAFALGRLGDRAACAPLLVLFRESLPEIRNEARISLELLADRSIEPEILAGLSSDDRSYRIACATLLGRVGTHRCIRPLVALFTNENEDLARASLRAVQYLTGRVPTNRPTADEIAAWETQLEKNPR